MKSITRTTWTELDYEFLRKNYLTMSNGEISEALGKTRSAIQNKLKVLGLKRPDKYTYQQNYFENSLIEAMEVSPILLSTLFLILGSTFPPMDLLNFFRWLISDAFNSMPQQ